MIQKERKVASKAEISRFIVGQIKKSDKAPPGFSKRIRGIAKDTAGDLKVKGKSLKIPWGFMLFIVPVLIGIYLVITGFMKPKDGGGYAPGDSPDEPIDIKGRDAQGLLSDFGYKKRG